MSKSSVFKLLHLADFSKLYQLFFQHLTFSELDAVWILPIAFVEHSRDQLHLSFIDCLFLYLLLGGNFLQWIFRGKCLLLFGVSNLVFEQFSQ